MTVLGAGQGLLGHGRAPPNHTAHRPATLLPSPGNRPFRLLSDPITRPCGQGACLGGYLGPRPARSRLSPNEESGAAASVVDESGHLTCLRLAHGGPAAAQCSSSGARGPDGSRAARRRSSALRASAPHAGLGPPEGVRVTEEISGQGEKRCALNQTSPRARRTRATPPGRWPVRPPVTWVDGRRAAALCRAALWHRHATTVARPSCTVFYWDYDDRFKPSTL